MPQLLNLQNKYKFSMYTILNFLKNPGIKSAGVFCFFTLQDKVLFFWKAKIMWLKQNISKKIDKYISIKEYIIFRLSGAWKTDYGLASTSGIFNSLNREYDKKIIEILGLTKNDLAEVYSGHHIFIFQINGREVSGILGSTDGALANLGAGSIDKSKTNCHHKFIKISQFYSC